MDKLVGIKYKKLYLKDDKLYLFDVPAFVEAMEKKKQILNISLATELELVAKDETQKKRMASRVKSYIRGNDECIGLNTIQMLGRAFGDGDEMAFLEEVEIETILQTLMQHEND